MTEGNGKQQHTAYKCLSCGETGVEIHNPAARDPVFDGFPLSHAGCGGEVEPISAGPSSKFVD